LIRKDSSLGEPIQQKLMKEVGFSYKILYVLYKYTHTHTHKKNLVYNLVYFHCPKSGNSMIN